MRFAIRALTTLLLFTLMLGSATTGAYAVSTKLKLPHGALDVPTSGTYLYLYSETGDWIGAGLEQLYTSADSTFHLDFPEGSNSESAWLVQGNYVHWWDVQLGAPIGQALLEGSYLGAGRYSFRPDNLPGMDIGGDSRGCNTLTGRFDIDEITRAANGQILTFQATFEQHCEGAVPALFGRLRVESPPLEPVVVDRQGLADRKSDTATVTGTLWCATSGAFDLQIGLFQANPNHDIVEAVATSRIDCVAPSTRWAVVLVPQTGMFQAGDAFVAVDLSQDGARLFVLQTVVQLNSGG
jgi:hypothetical protein